MGRLLSVLMLASVCITTPAWAQFEKLEDRQAQLAEERERYLKQLEDTAKTREALQENNTLLKGILIEMRRQSELLAAISAEQKNQTFELSRQSEVMEMRTGSQEQGLKPKQ